jgi:hypothetical protein
VRRARAALAAQALGAAVVVAGCASEPPAPRAWVTHSAGTLQCGAGAPDIARLTRELQAVGVEPQQVQCGHDGRTRPMMCGAPDGRLVAFLLRARDVQAAQRAGFAPLAQLPSAKLEPCP